MRLKAVLGLGKGARGDKKAGLSPGQKINCLRQPEIQTILRKRCVLPASLALFCRAVYTEFAVKQPFVNVEEKIDHFVGRRTKMPDALSTATSNKANAIAWRKAFGGARIPRGVYRFKTHEEADQWLCQMIARPRN